AAARVSPRTQREAIHGRDPEGAAGAGVFRLQRCAPDADHRCARLAGPDEHAGHRGHTQLDVSPALVDFRAVFRARARGADAAAPIVRYLADLGITDLYTSPILQAAPGSVHGYDVIDHGSINVELGGAEGYDRLSAALHEAGLGHVLDIVPNHMGLGSGNALWLDLLENGPSAQAAKFFDVEWHPVKEELADKVLVPVLGDRYGAVLERGEIQLELHEGAFRVRYYDHLFPVNPRSYGQILGYRIAPWRVSSEEINYRRFFDINSLAAVKMEDAEVFEHAHRLPLRLLAEGRVNGLRIDHPDGLAYPRRYFRLLQEAHILQRARARAQQRGIRWEELEPEVREELQQTRDPRLERPLYVVAEKILGRTETLPTSWAVAGTTGYDFLNSLNGIFVARENAEKLQKIYARFIHGEID